MVMSWLRDRKDSDSTENPSYISSIFSFLRPQVYIGVRNGIAVQKAREPEPILWNTLLEHTAQQCSKISTSKAAKLLLTSVNLELPFYLCSVGVDCSRHQKLGTSSSPALDYLVNAEMVSQIGHRDSAMAALAPPLG
ncbi:hypothetical protein AVEN_82756-1 [Araneus ventricosus]|uniref:Uncharacterized protein n=1 Tax=Araneus ventricosus TaxID=182803 RepID=A0A4Y2E935_ARAVE|nr:hypothetical protein AVEN_82756-1 [Araneus ventricosus]